jgi:hypothetical protein
LYWVISEYLYLNPRAFRWWFDELFFLVTRTALYEGEAAVRKHQCISASEHTWYTRDAAADVFELACGALRHAASPGKCSSAAVPNAA